MLRFRELKGEGKSISGTKINPFQNTIDACELRMINRKQLKQHFWIRFLEKLNILSNK